MPLLAAVAAALLPWHGVAEQRPLVVGVTEQWLGGAKGREKNPHAGVQFHPEGLVKYADDETFTRLFRNLPAFIGAKR